MIRCIRLWTGADDNSYFEEGVIDLPKGERGDILSGTVGVVRARPEIIESTSDRVSIEFTTVFSYHIWWL